ncbi:MAG: tetratricopeptide (TPR) repeat protein [Pseudohongiellaceae bacterium]|jgi:tetratricopeptide (TPR) repeat protein
MSQRERKPWRRCFGAAVRLLPILAVLQGCGDGVTETPSETDAAEQTSPSEQHATAELELGGVQSAAVPDDPALDNVARGLLGQAEMAMSQGRPDAVGALLKPVLARGTVPSRVRFVAGWAAYQLLRYEDSVTLMGQALAQDPGLLKDSRVLAFGHHKLGQFEAASQLFEDITEVAPQEYRAWYGWGLAELSLGHYESAEQHLERALADHPDYIKARYTLGRLYEEQGHAEQALPHVMFVLKQEPSHVEALYLLSRVQSALGFKDEAEVTVTRWRVAYEVRERLGPMQQLIIEGLATPAVFLGMAEQYALLNDHAQQGKSLRDGLRRFPGDSGLTAALVALAAAER